MPDVPRRAGRSPLAGELKAFPASNLGKMMTVVGRLATAGEIHVHGNVLGRIDASRLVVGVDGYVEGDVVAEDVQIGGRIHGRVFAINVQLDCTANIKGRIFHNTATIARGASVEGRMPWRPLDYFVSLEELPETQS
jgi:cytoskeletal protein CcmA (bactofilin family)